MGSFFNCRLLPKRLCDCALNLRMKGSCHVAFVFLMLWLFTSNAGKNQNTPLSSGIKVPWWVCGRREELRPLETCLESVTSLCNRWGRGPVFLSAFRCEWSLLRDGGPQWCNFKPLLFCILLSIRHLSGTVQSQSSFSFMSSTVVETAQGVLSLRLVVFYLWSVTT